MSQRDVERTLGRLLTDVMFRREFFSDPARASLGLGLQLTAHELDALLRLPAPRLAALEGDLDDRIRRFRIDDVEGRDGREGAATS
jgi:CO dehydrogenase/acetyl-CoA synthase delta subunit